MAERSLREHVHEAIRTGMLPHRRPDRMWGGPGAGATCTLCGVPVRRDELELELEFVQDDDYAEPAKYHVHLRCFTAWEIELDRPAQTPNGHNGHRSA
jgi:hypothetical protein